MRLSDMLLIADAFRKVRDPQRHSCRAAHLANATADTVSGLC